MSLLLSSQLVPNYLNNWAVWDFTLHTHPTHILSVNNCHHMCLDQGIWTEKTLKLTFIHQDSTCRSFYWFFQLVSNCFNHWGIGDSTIHRYPTRIKSPNHWHRMCLDHGVDTHKSLKWTFIHMGINAQSTVHAQSTVQKSVSLSMWAIWHWTQQLTVE